MATDRAAPSRVAGTCRTAQRRGTGRVGLHAGGRRNRVEAPSRTSRTAIVALLIITNLLPVILSSVALLVALVLYGVVVLFTGMLLGVAMLEPVVLLTSECHSRGAVHNALLSVSVLVSVVLFSDVLLVSVVVLRVVLLVAVLIQADEHVVSKVRLMVQASDHGVNKKLLICSWVRPG